jgi:6-phosphogluconolactonase
MFLKVKRLFLSLVFLTSMMMTGNTQHLIVGTYTSESSHGIYVYDFNVVNGKAKLVDSIAASNPSFLAVAPNNKYVYAVNENGKSRGGGKVSSFSFDAASGKLKELNQQSAMGDDPCYVVVDKTGKWVIVGNYSGGNVAILPIRDDHSLGEAVTVIQHKGKGANPKRQEGPHVHATVLSADNKYLFVPDLGTDKIEMYNFDEKTGSLKSRGTMKMPEASGPRHFVFHPSNKWAYLIQELSGMVTAFDYKNGKLTTKQSISLLPAEYEGEASSADIHVSPDGKFLYATNRKSSNTITIFKINKQTGNLSLVSYQSTLGSTPRNFNFDPSGNYLLVANQDSDEIVIFKVDKHTGLLKDSGNRISVSKPVNIKWITK